MLVVFGVEFVRVKSGFCRMILPLKLVEFYFRAWCWLVLALFFVRVVFENGRGHLS
jgi:hypothetical protein